MKKSIFLIALLLAVITANTFAQNTVTISPRTATINIGETANFSVTLNVLPGYDASVFLSSTWGLGSVNPSILNYPYTTSSTLSLKTYSYTKRGVYVVYVTAKIGDKEVKDSCILNVINTTPWRMFTIRHGETRPSYVLVDKHGNIYSTELNISNDYPTWNRGLTKASITNPRFDINSTPAGPDNTPVWQTLIDDATDAQYFLTEEGLYKFIDKNITIYNTTNSGLPNDTIKRGVLSSDGRRLWLGTPSGLALLENYSITRYDNTNTNSILGNEVITALALGQDGRLWIGTPKGLVVKNGDSWVRYTPENSGLPAPYIFSLAVGKDGAVWMGSGNIGSGNIGKNDCPESMVGLVKFDGSTWQQFNSTNSPLTSNYVGCLTVDSKGSLWVATASFERILNYKIVKGCGMLKYDGANWTSYTASNTLLEDNDVQWVGADRYDNIWVTCKESFGVMNEEGIPFIVNDVKEQPEPTDGIALYPNPTFTTFSISGMDNISSVKIMNSLGIEVSSTLLVISGTVDVDVSDLASGVYFVQIRTAAGMITKSIIVSH